jgi:predicted transcriptional regulator
MSEIDAEGIPVAGLSMKEIERKTEDYLKKYHPETLGQKPISLDVDKLLEVSLFLSHGYQIDLITAFDNPKIEARMRPIERTVQITQTCYNKIGADDGHSRFNAVHETSHVILHDHQYLEFYLNPARMIKRECHIYESAEWQAEHGGGALLMPLKTLIPFLEKLIQKQYDYFSIVNIIMETYKVSKKAVMSRLRQLPKPGLKDIVFSHAKKPKK